MNKESFKTVLYLPSQAAAETEATIVKWHVSPGNSFSKGQVLAEIESAKSTFDFEAPCEGTVINLLFKEGDSSPIESPVIEIETTDESLKNQIPPAGSKKSDFPQMKLKDNKEEKIESPNVINILGIGSYLPKNVVYNKELLKEHPDITEEYIFGVTGIKERRWAQENEKPSDMAYAASIDAIEKSGLSPKDIDGIIVSTSTPDVVMPSTACILQKKLGIRSTPAFDLNAACSGWLYGISMAKGMILSGIANNILVASVDMQSRVLDKSDRNTYFLFGDGAGATIVSAEKTGHKILSEILTADSKGLHMARRDFPGYEVPQNSIEIDPWMRLDGKALFRFATESFSTIIRNLVIKSGWDTEDVRWVVPHQANARILKAAAQRSGVAFDRFYLNIDRVGNTSSASIPLAISEIEKGLQKKDKIILCTVGAGITAAGLSLEW